MDQSLISWESKTRQLEQLKQKKWKCLYTILRPWNILWLKLDDTWSQIFGQRIIYKERNWSLYTFYIVLVPLWYFCPLPSQSASAGCWTIQPNLHCAEDNEIHQEKGRGLYSSWWFVLPNVHTSIYLYPPNGLFLLELIISGLMDEKFVFFFFFFRGFCWCFDLNVWQITNTIFVDLKMCQFIYIYLFSLWIF